MNLLYFIKYQPKLMLVDCIGLSILAELAHRRLCDWVWSQNCFPRAEPLLLAEVTRVEPAQWPATFKALQAKGWSLKRGTLYHAGVSRVLLEAQQAHAAAVSRGRKGARRRWRDACSMEEPMLKQWQLQSQSELQSEVQNSKNTERSAFNAAARKPCRKGEAAFMSDVTEVLNLFDPKSAEADLANWGGWWRNRYRENPDKARRILADISLMTREGRITNCPGAAAQDLWRRLP